MGDIGKGAQATSYPTALDVDTQLSDCVGSPCVGGDSIIAGHINNPAGAIVAIETALGITPQGTAASVAARLAIMLANDGGIPRGTAFPGAPVNTPQLFYRTDQNLVYYYNIGLGSFIQFLTASALSSYVPIASPVTITAQHTFNPPISEAPFTLGTNAQGQVVVGLNADQLEGLKPAVASGIATLNGSSLVVQEPASKGLASGVASLDANDRLAQNANTLWDGTYGIAPSNAPVPSSIKIAESLASGYLAPAWLATTVRVVTGTASVASTDSIIQVDATASSFTLTFPAASTIPYQTITVIKTTAANIVTLSGTFSGAVNPILSEQYEKVQIYSDGTNYNWLIPKIPKLSVYPTSTTIIPSATTVKIQFAGKDLDTNNNFEGITVSCTTPVASPGVVNATGHGFAVNDPVVFAVTGGALPTGLTAGTLYWIISAGFGANAFEVSASYAGTAINFTVSSSGTQTVGRQTRFTPTVPGVYLINTVADLLDTTTATQIITFLYKNGSVYKQTVSTFSIGASGNYSSPLSATVPMNGTTDYLEVLVSITGTGTLSYATGVTTRTTAFEAHKI